MRVVLVNIVVFLAGFATMAQAAPDVPRGVPIDVLHSRATFTIDHVFVSRVSGVVPLLSGQLQLVRGSDIPSDVRAVLDATKLRTDEPDRDTALGGPDYFDTMHFPTWTFVSRRITASGGGAFVIDGMLTIHGVSQPLTFQGRVVLDGSRRHYRAQARIDRTLFGMRGSRLDPVIGRFADIDLDIVPAP